MKPELEEIVSTLSLSELIETQTEIQDLITSKQDEEKGRLLGVFQEMANQSGLSVEEVFGITQTSTDGRQRKPARPKYQNPDDETQTWTGRGRKPHWVQDYLQERGWQEVSKEADTEDKATNKQEMTTILADTLIEQA
ncbi:MAG: H-NS histone family protein [Bacteroidetes bacterium]|nr:H-NS histone family protein [Bacteroidota bacterium]